MTSDSPKELTRNDPEWIRQFSREKAEMDRVSEANYLRKAYDEAYKEAYEECRQEVRIEMVKVLLAEGVALEVIAKVTHMSIEDVNKLTQ